MKNNLFAHVPQTRLQIPQENVLVLEEEDKVHSICSLTEQTANDKARKEFMETTISANDLQTREMSEK